MGVLTKVKIVLENGTPVSEKAISAFELELGFHLSDSFRTFILTWDGAKPTANVFKIDAKIDFAVQRFIPLAEITRQRQYIENIPDMAYPVALAEGGNYIFIDESKAGAVFYWDHDEPMNTRQVAANFGEFLDLLEPVDLKKDDFSDYKVKRVWVDPEFLKKLQKK